MKRLRMTAAGLLFCILLIILLIFVAIRARTEGLKEAEAAEEPAKIVEVYTEETHVYPVYVSLNIDRTYTPLTADTVLTEEISISESDAVLIAKTCWGEFNDVSRPEQVAAVAWVILNRLDSKDPFFPDTVSEIVRQPSQFLGFREDNPVDEEIFGIVCDVMTRWQMEKRCCGSVGRVIPKEIVAFHANKSWTENIYVKPDGGIWNWSLPSPYCVGQQNG